MARQHRPEQVINLTVPHELVPGDHFVMPRWKWDEHYLVTEVDGQRLTVVRYSWWHDRAYVWIWRHTHRRRT
jgi:tRNA G37 N-methylase TrmD